jgi:hypothetical protein
VKLVAYRMAATPPSEEKMKRRLVIGIAALAAAAAACSGAASGEGEIIEDFDTVVVNVSGGSVQIERSRGTPDWLAEASYSGDEPDFAPRVEEGVLIVNDGCGGLGSCTVDYLISVPEGTAVTVTADDADVTITEISAAVTITTGSGVVFLNTVKGPISVGTESGDVIGTKLEASSASFNSSSGDIDVAFERVIADLIVATGSGNVTAQLAGNSYNLTVDAGTGSTDVKIESDETSNNIVSLRTESGEITVYKQ